ncbi:MAG: hypothetical protein NVSMB24_33690 [Mucilaginibacter sp.]
MTDDISKQIAIGVQLDTDDLKQNITSLNKTIDSLLIKQQQLNTSGQQNTEAFNNIASTLVSFRKTLQDVQGQLISNDSALNTLSATGRRVEGSLSALTAQHQKSAKAASDNSVKIKELNTGLNSLVQSTTQQKGKTNEVKDAINAFSASLTKGLSGISQLQGGVDAASNAFGAQASVVNNSKAAFDAHKLTMDHLKTSFDEIKGISGEFGPSLEEASKGFNVMKTGLALVKDGFNGVGEAIKADGFGFLLEILQSIFDWFIHTSEGSKVLKGAISAIGVVVNKVKQFVNLFTGTIIETFSHPIDTLKSLGKMIEQNLINRFKAFGVILDGIIHLDFKKIANGAVQAFTGVTNATDKIGAAFTAVKNGVKDTANQMAGAFEDGYNQAGQQVNDHEKAVKESIERQKLYYSELAAKIKQVHGEQNDNKPENEQGDGSLVVTSGSAASATLPSHDDQVVPKNLTIEKSDADKTVEIKKTALQQVEDYAKKSAGKIASDALNTLNNSIKQQSDAKIAALEKGKANELNNINLTSAQKIAIQQKYKQQENKIKVKAFKEEQEVSITQAIINGALAITKGSAQIGALAALYVPAIIAETAVQVAKIAAQKPPAYAAGGLHYSSDGRGGVLSGYSKTDNTNAFLRSGEGIVVSEAMQVPWARNLVSAINVGFGGRDFSIANPGRGYAVGGIFTDGGDANRYYNQPVADQKNLANTIAYQMINNFPPVYVDVPVIAHNGFRRVFCLSITNDVLAFKGRPSSASATIDKIAFGDIHQGELTQLIVVSGGNVLIGQHRDYPTLNDYASIHDPARAYNALSVGTYTRMDHIDPVEWPGCRVMAPRGGMSLSNSTSLFWESQWPNKPDIVMEGGNMITNDNDVSTIPSLQLVSTNKRHLDQQLQYFGDTSGAAALTAKMAVEITTAYPQFWPETIRASIVHSADYTSEMLGNRDPSNLSSADKRTLLRRFGYGIPNLNRALYSTSNALHLVMERTIQPYQQIGNNIPKYNDYHLYQLPWPVDILRNELTEQNVRWKITLSYFIDPILETGDMPIIFNTTPTLWTLC